jgi:hypothetical protein
MIVKPAWFKQEVIWLRIDHFLWLLCTIEWQEIQKISVNHQTGLPGNGGERESMWEETSLSGNRGENVNIKNLAAYARPTYCFTPFPMSMLVKTTPWLVSISHSSLFYLRAKIQDNVPHINV